MPGNPLLNEQAILNTLFSEETPITPNQFRSLMSLTLLAAYDRKVKRKFFAEMLDSCAMMHIDLAKIEKAGAMRGLLAQVDAEREPQMVDQEISGIVTGFMAKRRSLAEKFSLITQCPTLHDKIS